MPWSMASPPSPWPSTAARFSNSRRRPGTKSRSTCPAARGADRKPSRPCGISSGGSMGNTASFSVAKSASARCSSFPPTSSALPLSTPSTACTATSIPVSASNCAPVFRSGVAWAPPPRRCSAKSAQWATTCASTSNPTGTTNTASMPKSSSTVNPAASIPISRSTADAPASRKALQQPCRCRA